MIKLFSGSFNDHIRRELAALLELLQRVKYLD